jgi:hypothetical protein
MVKDRLESTVNVLPNYWSGSPERSKFKIIGTIGKWAKKSTSRIGQFGHASLRRNEVDFVPQNEVSRWVFRRLNDQNTRIPRNLIPLDSIF